MHENEHQEDFEEIKSRSQIKREAETLQVLGKKLTELKPSQLKELSISEELRQAIHIYTHNIRQREALRRQMQYIGKLMRSEDAEAIQAFLDRYDSSSKAFAQVIHQQEAWRTRLIEEGKQALTDFVEAFPDVDVQHLRQLIRNAQKDQKNQKNTGAAKKLFQYIRQLTLQA